jgi:hypothetical protein
VKKALERVRLTPGTAHVLERPCDGSHLGPVIVGFLRGNRSILPPCRCARLASARSAGGFARRPRLLRTGRTGNARDARCLKQSGPGRSLSREQSREGASRLGDPRPLTLRTFGGRRRSRGNDRSMRRPSRPRTPRPGCSSGPSSCSLKHRSAEVVEAHAANRSPRKRRGERSSRGLESR